MQTDYAYRTATADDWDSINLLLGESFNEDLSGEWGEIERSVFEPDRTVLAEAPTIGGRELAGISSAFTRDVTVPGGVVPAAHVTMVSVSSVHRRRGILRAMISRLHDQALGLGEPVAMLWASEARIYQRFGYGLAASRLVIEADRREVSIRPEAALPESGQIRRVDPKQTEQFVKVYDQVLAGRPGWSARNEVWWRYVTADPAQARDGATALRAAVHEGPDGIDGYVLWRVKSEWDTTPSGTVKIRELVATTPEAYQSLWRFVMAIDLTRKVSSGFSSLDEPMYYLVDEPRALAAKVTDSLWVRLLSVPDALAARRYATPTDVVLEVTDRDLPANAGRWRLTGGPDAARCTPTGDPADVRLDVAALGAAYLGGPALAPLAASGLVTELRPDALRQVSTALRGQREPSATEVF